MGKVSRRPGRAPAIMLYTIDSRMPGRAPAIMLRAYVLADLGVASPELPGPKPKGKGR